jgi:hypothetical protein
LPPYQCDAADDQFGSPFAVSDEGIACTKTICNYVYETYGRFPGGSDAMHLMWVMQVHHLDTDFYDRFSDRAPMAQPVPHIWGHGGGSGGFGGSLCFPFPTPGNGQQESRLALIGRHLRLLRRRVLRTGCFPRQAAFQGGHEIDDGWRGRDLPGFNGEPLHLGFD